MGIPLEKRDITRFPGSHARPHLIQINRSANILLEDFLIRGSPFWNIHLFHSENVVVRRVDIYSHGHNTDGIDIDMTKNVIVENCIFDQGDDAIILKAARNHDAWRLRRSTENVVVRHCTVRNGHVLMGAGSDVSGGIRNVLMHDCQMVGNVNNIFFVKTNERRGGFVENIYMKDCSVEMRGKSVPTSVVGIETDVLYEWRNLPTWEVRVTRIRNIDVGGARDAHPQHLRGERPCTAGAASPDGPWRRARSRGRRDAQERDVRRDDAGGDRGRQREERDDGRQVDPLASRQGPGVVIFLKQANTRASRI